MVYLSGHRKSIITYVLLLVFVLILEKHELYSNDLKKVSLRGNVMEVTNTSYEENYLNGKFTALTHPYRELVKYNQSGYKTEYIVFSTDGTTESKTIYLYINNLIDRETYYHNNTLTKIVSYYYNDIGLCIKQICEDSSQNTLYCRVFLYNDDNCNIDTIVSRKNDKDIHVKKKFDTNNRVIEEKEIYPDSSLRREHYWEYNANGRLASEIENSFVGNIYYRIIYKYDINNNDRVQTCSQFDVNQTIGNGIHYAAVFNNACCLASESALI